MTARQWLHGRAVLRRTRIEYARCHVYIIIIFGRDAAFVKEDHFLRRDGTDLGCELFAPLEDWLLLSRSVA